MDEGKPVLSYYQLQWYPTLKKAERACACVNHAMDEKRP